MDDPESGPIGIREHVAAEVRAELARRRISTRHFARSLGWGTTATHRRITGESPLDVGHLFEIAQNLDISPEKFFPPLAGKGDIIKSTSPIWALAS